MTDDVANEVKAHLEGIQTKVKRIVELSKNGPDPSPESKKTASEIHNHTEEIKALIEKLSKGKDQFLEDYNLQVLYDYLDSLSL